MCQYKDQSNACRCEMVLKELKGALTVLIVTHVTHGEEAALLSFLDLSTTRVIAGKTHSQSPILKTKGHSATW